MNLRRSFEVLILVMLAITFENASSYSNFTSRAKRADSASHDPLIITPLLNKGMWSEARYLASVYHRDMRNVISYSGYFTIDDFNSNLFFWYFPSKSNQMTAPVILFLEGAFGLTSLFSLFAQNGPFKMNSAGNLEMREDSWTNKHHVIYMDSAVDSGYSFTPEKSNYPKNLEQVSSGICKALVQFFDLFFHLRKNDFFVAGDTYGGKLVPLVTFLVHEYNAKERSRPITVKKLGDIIADKIRLKGMLIGNGYANPEYQLAYGEYFFSKKMIDASQKKFFDNKEKKILDFIRADRYVDAYNEAEEYLHDLKMKSVIQKFNDTEKYLFDFPYNSLPTNYVEKKEREAIFTFIQSSDVRRALHVGDRPFSRASNDLKDRLRANLTDSQANYIAVILNDYQVLILTGQSDYSCLHKSVVSYLEGLIGSATQEYRSTEREEWRDPEGNLAGSIRRGSRLTEVLLYDVGHLIFREQPKRVLHLLESWTRGSIETGVGNVFSITSCMKTKGRYCALYRSSVIRPQIFALASHAGYITINKASDSNLFFWYFAAELDPQNAPVILYLQGALGMSSIVASFMENGPFLMNAAGKVQKRELSWHKKHHLIYIDSPVGSGYSYTNSETGYAKNDSQVADHLLEALVQFFQLHPQLQKKEFFVAGDNYAGKFIPALGNSIHLYNMNGNGSSKINLKGMIIVNGYVDPINQFHYGERLANYDGIINDHCKNEFMEMENKVRDFINKNQHTEAYQTTENFLSSTDKRCYFGTSEDANFPFNVRPSYTPINYKLLLTFLNRTDIRRTLHVGDTAFIEVAKEVKNHLKDDLTRSQATTLASLLEHYRVLIFSGGQDSICSSANVKKYISELTWSGAERFNTSPETKWNDRRGDDCGKLKKGGNLTLMLLTNGKHWISNGLSEQILEILEKFIDQSL